MATGLFIDIYIYRCYTSRSHSLASVPVRPPLTIRQVSATHRHACCVDPVFLIFVLQPLEDRGTCTLSSSRACAATPLHIAFVATGQRKRAGQEQQGGQKQRAAEKHEAAARHLAKKATEEKQITHTLSLHPRSRKSTRSRWSCRSPSPCACRPRSTRRRLGTLQTTSTVHIHKDSCSCKPTHSMHFALTRIRLPRCRSALCPACACGARPGTHKGAPAPTPSPNTASGQGDKGAGTERESASGRCGQAFIKSREITNCRGSEARLHRLCGIAWAARSSPRSRPRQSPSK